MVQGQEEPIPKAASTLFIVESRLPPNMLGDGIKYPYKLLAPERLVHKKIETASISDISRARSLSSYFN